MLQIEQWIEMLKEWNSELTEEKQEEETMNMN
jgi:hypothetical protein